MPDEQSATSFIFDILLIYLDGRSERKIKKPKISLRFDLSEAAGNICLVVVNTNKKVLSLKPFDVCSQEGPVFNFRAISSPNRSEPFSVRTIFQNVSVCTHRTNLDWQFVWRRRWFSFENSDQKSDQPQEQ